MHWAVAWANVDPDRCRHMAALGHSEVKWNLTIFHANICMNVPLPLVELSWDFAVVNLDYKDILYDM